MMFLLLLFILLGTQARGSSFSLSFLVCFSSTFLLTIGCSSKEPHQDIKVSQCALALVDVLFADDTLLFARATRQKVDNLLSIIKSYTMASGQSINFQKSHILFTKHTPLSLKHELLCKFYMHELLLSNHYLGRLLERSRQ